MLINFIVTNDILIIILIFDELQFKLLKLVKLNRIGILLKINATRCRDLISINGWIEIVKSVAYI